MHWEIYPLIPSELVIDMGRMTYLRNYGDSQWLPCPFFVIRNRDTILLVDTSGPAETMSKMRVEPVRDLISFEGALATIGLSPSDIGLVLLTHLMYDHCANAKALPNAKFLVQKAELDYARNPHPFLSGAYRPELFEGLNFELLEGDRQILPGVKAVFTPGHSPGCQSVAVDTIAGTVVITGFCCTMDNFTAESGSAWIAGNKPEVIPPGIHLDMREAYSSAKRVKDLADIILPMHDSGLKKIIKIPT